jgi:long-chain fatty acid transport protein
MRSATRSRWLLLVVGGALTVPGPAFATDGYFAHGYGTENKAMAGAGVALSLNTLAPATNPAGLAFLGTRYDVGFAVFSPNREFSVTGLPSGFPGTFGLAPGTVESGSTAFPVPSMGASWRAGENGAFGVAVYGNGGMNTDYAEPVFGFAPVGVDLSQLFVAPTYAHRLSGKHALGLSLIGAYQRFEARGLQAFRPMSSDGTSLTNNDHAHSYGIGARVGYQGHLSSWLSVGAAYQTPVAMTDFLEAPGAQTIDLKMDQWDFDLSFSFGF